MRVDWFVGTPTQHDDEKLYSFPESSPTQVAAVVYRDGAGASRRGADVPQRCAALLAPDVRPGGGRCRGLDAQRLRQHRSLPAGERHARSSVDRRVISRNLPVWRLASIAQSP